MNLYLLRHGLAEERDPRRYPDDSQRPLTAEGVGKMRRIASGMRALKLEFDVWLSSPYLRARQTAEIVAAAYRAKRRLQFIPELEPGVGPRRVVRYLCAHLGDAQNALLVGHEPDLSELAAFLLAGESLPITLKKGGMCLLTLGALTEGPCAALEWLLTPKQLAALGSSK